jgi:threonine/homoserine/homoserine lactone efflux protein
MLVLVTAIVSAGRAGGRETARVSLGIAFVSGIVAGLAIALPLGAIGVLLVTEGMDRGVRRGLPAALGVATVDALYCTAAIIAGSVVAPVTAQLGEWPRLVGGLALVVLAIVGARRAVASDPDTAAGAPSGGGGSARRFGLFFALTLINPATVIYFAALVSGLTALRSSPGTAGMFIAGVAAASFAWQAALVAVGSAVRARVSGRARRVTALVGNAVVGALGVGLIVVGLGAV